VQAFRTSGYNGDFSAWYMNGKPTPAQPTVPTPAGPPIGDPSAHIPTPGVANPWDNPDGSSKLSPTVPPPVAPPAPAAPVAPDPSKYGSTATVDNLGFQPPDPASLDKGSTFEDIIKRYEGMLNPAFERQQTQALRKLRAEAAKSGQIDSGGFGTNQAELLTGLGAQQSAIVGDFASKGYEAEKERELSRFVESMKDATMNFGIQTNADLERFLQKNEMELKKYGIDKDDLLQRYKAGLDLEGTKYSADSSLKAANLHAAASAAAANAGAGAAMYGANIQRELGLLNADVDRENNIMRFILGMYGVGNDQVRNIIGTSPDSWFNDFNIPGNVVVRP
jgi:hypothetical protein